MILMITTMRVFSGLVNKDNSDANTDDDTGDIADTNDTGNH